MTPAEKLEHLTKGMRLGEIVDTINELNRNDPNGQWVVSSVPLLSGTPMGHGPYTIVAQPYREPGDSK